MIKDIKRKVVESLPKNVKVKDVEFEGPFLVVYVRNPQEIANVDIVKKLAKDLRKRIIIRSDPKSLKPKDEAEKIIMEIVPEDAKITSIFFDEENCEVIIEAEKPGVVIGKGGTTFRRILKETGWSPRVVRTPPLKSRTIESIRSFLLGVRDERKEILKRIGENINKPILHLDKWVRVTFLGGAREVGRSCYLLQTPNSRILIECGINVSGNQPPYLYVPEVQPLDSIDAIIITHAHLDHCGLVPILFKYGYRGPVYMTPPTRDLMTLLQLDFIEVASREGSSIPYESHWIRKALKYCITLDYGVVTDIAPDVRLTFYNAGHILGSAIAHFHIGEGLYNIAFTGDFKFERTRLFDRAETNFPRLEALIMEATYGGSQDLQPSRKEAEENLIRLVNETVKGGGKVLIPAFAVGRSQEVMMVIEEAIRMEKMDEVPVYIDGMIYEATAIHTAYPEYLNEHLRNLIFQQGINPFMSENFIRVDSPSKRQEVIDSSEPCVIISTSGMLNGGPVMEYFKALAGDEKNTLIFVGYQAEGTLGRRIQKGWNEVPFTVDGRREVVKVNMRIETVDGFSGHSDRRQLINFVKSLSDKPERVITVHGEESKCLDLASSIYKMYRIETRAPMNLETLRFT